jgi:hypothetical protein
MGKKKLFLLGLVVYPILFAATTASVFREPQIPIEIEPKPIQPISVVEIEPLEILIDAMIIVESQGNDSAIGDKHLGSNYAVGALQIRPIMVKEVNRILKLKGDEHRFKLKDRYDREKSIQMFMIWKEFHHKDSDYEEIARSWNGGPNGPKKSRTYNYWKKVENQLAGL